MLMQIILYAKFSKNLMALEIVSEQTLFVIKNESTQNVILCHWAFLICFLIYMHSYILCLWFYLPFSVRIHDFYFYLRIGSIIYPFLSLHLINLSAEMFPFLAHILEPFLYNQANVCFWWNVNYLSCHCCFSFKDPFSLQYWSYLYISAMFKCSLRPSWTSLIVQLVKNPPAMQETWVQSLD